MDDLERDKLKAQAAADFMNFLVVRDAQQRRKWGVWGVLPLALLRKFKKSADSDPIK